MNLKRIVFLLSSESFWQYFSKKPDTISNGLRFWLKPFIQWSEKIGNNLPVSLIDLKGNVKKILL